MNAISYGFCIKCEIFDLSMKLCSLLTGLLVVAADTELLSSTAYTHTLYTMHCTQITIISTTKVLSVVEQGAKYKVGI